MLVIKPTNSNHTPEAARKWLAKLLKKKPVLIFFMLFLFVSCGKDESPIPSPSASSTPVATVAPSSEPTKVASDAKKDAPVAINSAAPAPSALPSAQPSQFVAHGNITSQPFETNAWKFDITSGFTLSNGATKIQKNVINVYKKSIDQWGVTTVTTCVFRMIVDIPAGIEDWGKITLISGVGVGISGGQPAACGATPPQYSDTIEQYINFKISNKCQGYSQDSYKCGQGNIKYDLVTQS